MNFMSDIIFDFNYEYCWKNVEYCSSFDVRGYSDKIQIVEDRYNDTKVIAEFDIASVPLDLEDLWIQMADVFDAHIAGWCYQPVDFDYLKHKVETVRYAEKHGADEKLIRSMMTDALSPDGEYWIWTDYEFVVDRMLGVMRREVDTSKDSRGNYADLNSYLQTLPLSISDRFKTHVIDRLSVHYDILDNKICVKSDSGEDFLE